MPIRQFLSELTAPIQVAVLNGLGDVIHQNIGFAFQVGDGAGDLEHAVKGAGRKAQFVDGRFQQRPGRRIDVAVGFDMAAAHLGVAVEFGSGKSL